MGTILDDEQVRGRMDMSRVIQVIDRAMSAHAEGRLVAPPRVVVPFGDRGDLVFTVGGELDGSDAAGFRVYDRFKGDSPDRNQLVAVFDSRTGAFRGAIVGHALGAIRTGAIGGVAIAYLSRADSFQVGMVGAGAQARTQLEAMACVRAIEHVRVFSRTASGREQFAAEMSERVGVDVEAVDSPRDAVDGADIVVTSTTGGEPVIVHREGKDLVAIIPADALERLSREDDLKLPERKDEGQPVWEKVVQLGGRIPPEDWRDVPKDLSINLDHYLYGAPKDRE